MASISPLITFKAGLCSSEVGFTYKLHRNKLLTSNRALRIPSKSNLSQNKDTSIFTAKMVGDRQHRQSNQQAYRHQTSCTSAGGAGRNPSTNRSSTS